MQGHALPLEASLLRNMETLAHRADFSPNAGSLVQEPPATHPAHVHRGGPFSRRLPGEAGPLSARPWALRTLTTFSVPSLHLCSIISGSPAYLGLCPQPRRPARRMGGRASWNIAAGSEVSGLFSVKFSKRLLLSHRKTIDF